MEVKDILMNKRSFNRGKNVGHLGKELDMIMPC